MRESSDTWTVWTPIEDWGEEIGGGLGFIPGSNRAGLLDAEMTMMEVESTLAASGLQIPDRLACTRACRVSWRPGTHCQRRVPHH